MNVGGGGLRKQGRYVKRSYRKQPLLLWSIHLMFHQSRKNYGRGGADKSLARPTSQCRKKESIVSLERGVCSCDKLQIFSCYRGWREARQATRAISSTSRCELSSRIFFPARQGAELNSHQSDRNIRGTCTIVCHCQKLGGQVWTSWFFHL